MVASYEILTFFIYLIGGITALTIVLYHLLAQFGEEEEKEKTETKRKKK